MALLEIDDLHVTYRSTRGDVPAVRGVSLHVDAGETVGVAGESGCGKSTVAASVLRLLPSDATVTGQVRIDGADVLDMSWGRLRAVRWAEASIVFQGAMHSLNPVRRVGRQVAEPIMLHSSTSRPDAEARAVELLAQVGLPAWRADSYPHELSGGQRQRVMIAMALACGPRLIVADEATTALDVMIQAQVLRVLRDLVTEHEIALVMISHDLSVLADVCQDLAVMYAGRVAERGPAAEMFASAAHPYSRALAAAFPVVGDPAARRRPSGLGGDPPDPAALPGGCAFQPRCAIAVDECLDTDVALREVSSGWSAACLRAYVPQSREGVA